MQRMAKIANFRDTEMLDYIRLRMDYAYANPHYIPRVDLGSEIYMFNQFFHFHDYISQENTFLWLDVQYMYMYLNLYIFCNLISFFNNKKW